MKTWKTYIFADGTRIMCAKMSADEKRACERKYGKLININ